MCIEVTNETEDSNSDMSLSDIVDGVNTNVSMTIYSDGRKCMTTI